MQPSRRPKDGRYGENPNRLQHYYQFQVALKPSPEDIVDIYLKSLEYLGFNLQENDVRFVEDNWENPTLGAWGLGWEVWLNGMEVTQFTYFQQVGGITCKPITGEITYGLERLAMYIQEVDSVYDLADILKQAFDMHMLDADSLMMLEGVLNVSEMQVRDIMIPRSQMDYIDISKKPEEFIPFVIETAHSRFPVMESDMNDVIGILLAKDLLNFHDGEDFELRDKLTF